ncbi:MAG: hypothetical protein KatS3mg115_0043 [Candidatus Poribacteria bacterium]|nr:MAG: hypothetical protein KatS3mg115_0043 [Candidatus Poribacteria bacterium]
MLRAIGDGGTLQFALLRAIVVSWLVAEGNFSTRKVARR